MTDYEFKKVSMVFLDKLADQMANSGCNDVNPDEYPQSICDKYGSDFNLFADWIEMFWSKISLTSPDKPL